MLKKGSHLDGVEPITENVINVNELIDILEKKIGVSETVKYIKHIVEESVVCDKSGYSGNSVLISEKDNKKVIIKISKSGQLYEEYVAYNYFYKNGLSSKPIKYLKENGYEVLITEFINLPTAGIYFDSYKDIAAFLGKELYKFHETTFLKCTTEEMKIFKSKYDKSYAKALSNDVVLVYMSMYFGNCDINKMKKYLIDNKWMLHANEKLVHGDINPNNIFIDEGMKLKYIDFCDTGYCNKHYDIFWTIFMIIIFSGILKEREKIEECENIFIDAYGRKNINEKELMFFKYFVSLYWKQHDEITRINIL